VTLQKEIIQWWLYRNITEVWM